MILNYNSKTLKIKSFMPSQFEEANSIYNSIESTRAETKIDAVLVNIQSLLLTTQCLLQDRILHCSTSYITCSLIQVVQKSLEMTSMCT